MATTLGLAEVRHGGPLALVHRYGCFRGLDWLESAERRGTSLARILLGRNLFRCGSQRADLFSWLWTKQVAVSTID
jgi:hypothetical protein